MGKEEKKNANVAIIFNSHKFHSDARQASLWDFFSHSVIKEFIFILINFYFCI